MLLTGAKSNAFEVIIKSLTKLLEQLIGRSLGLYGSALVYGLLVTPVWGIFLYKWQKNGRKYWTLPTEKRESLDVWAGLSYCFYGIGAD